MIVRPRRSVLYVPGSNARALAKSRGLDADAVIVDLEDAVAPADKPAARAAAVRALAEGGFGHREVVVRVNGLETPWGPEDVAAVAAALVQRADDAAIVGRGSVPVSRDQARREKADVHSLTARFFKPCAHARALRR